jgi:hypothetical protein
VQGPVFPQGNEVARGDLTPATGHPRGLDITSILGLARETRSECPIPASLAAAPPWRVAGQSRCLTRSEYGCSDKSPWER